MQVEFENCQSRKTCTGFLHPYKGLEVLHGSTHMEDYLGTSTCRVTQYLGILIIKEGHTHYLFILWCNLIREQALRSAPAVITDLLEWMPWTHSTVHALI